jgi:ribosomal protein S18 acetylase RimI-like enzyme
LTSWSSENPHQPPINSDSAENTRQLFVRAATMADLDFVAQIIAESFHSQTGFWGWLFPLLRLGIHEDLKHRLATTSPHHICLVAIENISGVDKVIGTVELGVRFCDNWTCTGKSFPYLSNLAVLPQYRRQGAASKLLQQGEKFIQEWGFTDVYLHVLEENHHARQLYLKLGYRVHLVETNLNSFSFMRSLRDVSRSRQMFLHKKL